MYIFYLKVLHAHTIYKLGSILQGGRMMTSIINWHIKDSLMHKQGKQALKYYLSLKISL